MKRDIQMIQYMRAGKVNGGVIFFIIWTVALAMVGPVGWFIWFVTGGFLHLETIMRRKNDH